MYYLSLSIGALTLILAYSSLSHYSVASSMDTNDPIRAITLPKQCSFHTNLFSSISLLISPSSSPVNNTMLSSKYLTLTHPSQSFVHHFLFQASSLVQSSNLPMKLSFNHFVFVSLYNYVSSCICLV
ncbi:hypothetical protein V8G54_000568 [Vigna mungo]|uniref:Uncharacterized protein n=1 Tax=Vigna mungo TaxID=3915 RepID=A0AAQ3SAY6_VIGMU